MAFKAGPEIDVIALDGEIRVCLLLAPVGLRPAQGQTMLGWYAPPEPRRLAAGAQAVAKHEGQLVMARPGKTEPSPGIWPGAADRRPPRVVFARRNARATTGRTGGPREYRAPSALHEFSR